MTDSAWLIKLFSYQFITEAWPGASCKAPKNNYVAILLANWISQCLWVRGGKLDISISLPSLRTYIAYIPLKHWLTITAIKLASQFPSEPINFTTSVILVSSSETGKEGKNPSLESESDTRDYLGSFDYVKVIVTLTYQWSLGPMGFHFDFRNFSSHSNGWKQ